MTLQKLIKLDMALQPLASGALDCFFPSATIQILPARMLYDAVAAFPDPLKDQKMEPPIIS